MSIINKTTLSETKTSEELSEFDLETISTLSGNNLEWIKMVSAEKKLGQTKEEILNWLRRQSNNKIYAIGTRALAGYTVVKSWMYDPNEGSVFIAFSPYLFDGDSAENFVE